MVGEGEQRGGSEEDGGHTCLGLAAEGLRSHQVGPGLKPQLVGLEAVAEPQSADICTHRTFIYF